ncbi:UDP-2,4-diacetamido-2,4,6-trideoxy-beta-L-altropyranose hydrolase [Asticcacaulis sp. EMRT-3]|uniref:UDP-2,4-diacetamido-2,4, 6-trideoxy-beta-L-altropyranose hydrolase n=1 Tax=Asticcacaulis sp. EMRT-3 TaxID=3040349 RepID=UPI0024AF8E4B|nr:UDP-2,4-diacetamido-2,4,6-trideoxy-beta-L-altropyranose hydrolase [Asticcacaulis sp. EMRT-3]MDI7776137.1 UDP-2,4-diacetamido-2,4,6-trideoxy-beta-L-altropyranose hydrolase [Asticcacaulis sp. EMRT-3]
MRLFIRTQASSAIGMGHFMRCFAIAEAARAQGLAVTFLLDALEDGVRQRLSEIGADGVVIPALGSGEDLMRLSELGLTRRDWLIVDSYAADEAYLAALSLLARLCVIDDLGLLAVYDADLLINPALAAPDMGYATKTRARCLLGAPYALIRREFREAVARPDGVVTIMFGGSDPQNLSAACAEILLHNDMFRVRIIAGPANAHIAGLRALAALHDRLEVVASPPSVAEALSDSALVITAAGGTVGELAAMGLPALVLVVYDNQAAALSACPYPVIDARTGLPTDLTLRVAALLADPAGRVQNGQKAHGLVDGLGPRRIMEAMTGV